MSPPGKPVFISRGIDDDEINNIPESTGNSDVITNLLIKFYNSTFLYGLSSLGFGNIVKDLITVYNETFRKDFFTNNEIHESHNLGNFISDAFSLLIRPFFKIGIEILTQVTVIFEALLENLVDDLEKLVELFCQFLEVLGNFIFSTIIKLESKYMFFEYVCGFACLLYFTKLLYLSIIIIVSLTIIFGVKRSDDNFSIFF